MAGWPHCRGLRRHDAVREVPAARGAPVAGHWATDRGLTVSDVIHDLHEHGWSVERIADALNTTQSRVEAHLASPQTQPAHVPDEQRK